MKDMIPRGTGNSRLMKSNIPANISHQQLVDMLRTGTFPYDLGTINADGILVEGTPINRTTLLSDELAQMLGYQQIESTTVNNALASILLLNAAMDAGYTSAAFSKPNTFNILCGILGIPIKSTWVATCTDATAKVALMQNGALMHVILATPALAASFGGVPFTLDNIKLSVNAGWYDLWPIGSAVDIALSAFTFGSAFAAGTYTFELVGIDQDINPNGDTLPMTLFMRNLHATTFRMYTSNVNTFTQSTAYTARNALKGALPTAWQDAMAPLVRKQIAAKGNAAPVAYDLPCFLYREGEILSTRMYSRVSEFNMCQRYQIYANNKSTLPKKMSNGTGVAATFWECSPSSGVDDAGATGAYCYIDDNGSASSAGASNYKGLCFGFCIAREQQ